jgi:hypothetical protein
MYVIANNQSPSRRNDRNSPELQVLAPARPEPRERDFGVGYGNSRGYVSNRRYANHWGAVRFQCS